MPALGADSLLSLCQVPIIDLGHMDVDNYQRSCVKRVATQMHKSLADKGIALLVNHGIPEQKLRKVYKYMNKFCCLSEKHKSEYLSSTHTEYVPPTNKDSFSFSIEDKHTILMKSFPNNTDSEPESCDHLPELQKATSEVSEEFRKITKLLLQALAISIDLSPKHFLKTHENILQDGNESNLKLVYYPSYENHCEVPCDYNLIDEGIVDDGTITLTAQDSECGIEIFSPTKNKWLRIGHLPGAILINTGKLLENWTSGTYKALKHRIIIPEPSNQTLNLKNKGRYYLSFNVHPDLNTSIEPLYHLEPTPESHNEEDSKKQQQHKDAKTHWYSAYQHVQKRLKNTKYFWKTMDVRIQT